MCIPSLIRKAEHLQSVDAPIRRGREEGAQVPSTQKRPASAKHSAYPPPLRLEKKRLAAVSSQKYSLRLMPGSNPPNPIFFQVAWRLRAPHRALQGVSCRQTCIRGLPKAVIPVTQCIFNGLRPSCRMQAAGQVKGFYRRGPDELAS